MLPRDRACWAARHGSDGRATGRLDTVTGGATMAAISGSDQDPTCTAIVVAAQSASDIEASELS